ncbi:peptidylprolyl isomerase [Oscillatoria acuminata]|uniref:Parvulin-like peptidyl-prolyl isomerase n=1 Tax=Oscillatoria acuminata PCC 6304 TaxID=56110 RepID=K9TPB9_9CYAN|nr:hypothetical protein [Oscillatoria acuminata]AFY83839.1 hypothetical protein Oscil6304_4313 [Oscillatoria acuminata PCC 6304]
MKVSQTVDLMKIGTDTISLQEALSYLKQSGQFGQFVSTVLREYIIEREIQILEFCPSQTEIEQFLLDFRIQNRIIESQAFEQWLFQNQLTYEQFRERSLKGLNFQKLREQVVQGKVEAFFAENSRLFDRLVLSRLVVEGPNLSHKIGEMLNQDPQQFKALVGEYSIAEDRVLDGRMGVFPWQELPPQLKSELDGKSPGDIVGPIVVDGLFCFFKIDQILEAKLNDTICQEIENRLFEEWLRGKMQGNNIQMLV